MFCDCEGISLIFPFQELYKLTHFSYQLLGEKVMLLAVMFCILSLPQTLPSDARWRRDTSGSVRKTAQGWQLNCIPISGSTSVCVCNVFPLLVQRNWGKKKIHILHCKNKVAACSVTESILSQRWDRAGVAGKG